MHDIIIIGAGPAGLTAAIYARRAEKSVLIIEKETFGGQMTFSPKIENYPGMISFSGTELADKMVEQALSMG
ncbi:MAG: NAD(P)/FAD-dependent oxidoreductase, partial [Firmicutes bacterium]|nr:NAD(P)/FAD-dependent oxidoreductase [Bacillota bacterium]